VTARPFETGWARPGLRGEWCLTSVIGPDHREPCKRRGGTRENCPRNAYRASRRNARETLTVCGHEEWVVDAVSCRAEVTTRYAKALDGLQRDGVLIDGVDRYSPAVRDELVTLGE
jgi:hypothetical protein